MGLNYSVVCQKLHVALLSPNNAEWEHTRHKWQSDEREQHCLN